MTEKVQALLDIDRTIHEPGRLVIMALLSAVEWADFVYLLNETQLTRGNLATHLAKLEQAGYIETQKGYRGRVPQTICRLTPSGRTAFDRYRKILKATL